MALNLFKTTSQPDAFSSMPTIKPDKLISAQNYFLTK